MLSLGQADQEHLKEGIESLLSPLDFSDRDAWRLAVNRKLQPLMRADVSSFFLPVEGRAEPFCEQRPGKVDRYPEYLKNEEGPEHLQVRLRQLQVADRKVAWGPHYRTLAKTRYWNEFARPLRLFDSLTICVPTGPEPRIEHSAQIIFNHDASHRAGFNQRELSLGRLILPALKAGVFTWLRLSGTRHAFAVSIDDLDTPVAMYDLSGRELHRNTALRMLLRDEQQADLVLAAGRQMAIALGSTANRGVAANGIDGNVEQWLSNRERHFLLRASRISPSVSGHTDAVIITIQERARRLPDEQELRTHFGLTRQQARVALLLAERKTNAEIAETFCISPHTARHHTEAVMDKLGISDRREVRTRIIV